MSIIDYEAVGKVAKDKLFSRTDISKKNFEYLNKYLNQYDVSPARLNIFYRHIGHFLSRTEDVKKDMNDRDKINKIFNELRTKPVLNGNKKLSSAYYSTIVNVTLTFVRWLNDGEKPSGFKDIKNTNKKKNKRDLTPEDMITWEDGLNMVKQTTSLQTKALLLTQLCGGFRPSEIYDLKIGDITKEGKYLVAHVNGKTGKRAVILFKCVTTLQRWLENHPDKENKKAYLWVIENQDKVHRKSKSDTSPRPTYNGLTKKIRLLATKCNIDKPMDFYNMRHSSAVINKIDGWEVSLLAKNMGHSIAEHESTYGRLSLKDNIDRLNKVYGFDIGKKEKGDLPLTCDFCDYVNDAGIEYCEKCNNPLTLKVALKDKESSSKDINELKEKNKAMEEMMQKMNEQYEKMFKKQHDVTPDISKDLHKQIYDMIKKEVLQDLKKKSP